MSAPRNDPFQGLLSGSAPHGWQQCSPPEATLTGPLIDAATRELFRAATVRAWSTLGPVDKKAFHEYVCQGRVSTARRAVIDRFAAMVKERAQADADRHAENARQTLEFAEKIGLQTQEPPAGEEIHVLAIRVADSVIFGDDPHPALALRRKIVACTRCGENCWLDPLTYGQAIPVTICMRCVDPKVGEAVEREYAKRKGAKP